MCLFWWSQNIFSDSNDVLEIKNDITNATHGDVQPDDEIKDQSTNRNARKLPWTIARVRLFNNKNY